MTERGHRVELIPASSPRVSEQNEESDDDCVIIDVNESGKWFKLNPLQIKQEEENSDRSAGHE